MFETSARSESKDKPVQGCMIEVTADGVVADLVGTVELAKYPLT